MARFDISDALGVGLNIAAHKYKPVFNQKALETFKTRDKLTVIQADRIYTAGHAVSTGTLQAYQSAFTPNNQVTVNSYDIKLKDCKVDIEITPANIDHLLDKWAPQLRQFGDDLIANEFIRKMYEEIILPQYMEDLEYQVVYNGVAVAPIPGTAGTPAAAVNGFGKIIADAITATTLTPIATGTFSSANVYDKIVAFTRALPQVYRGIPGEIYCSRGLFELYYDALLAKNQYTQNTMTVGDGNSVLIPTTNKTLTVLPSMYGSNRLIFDGSRGKDNLVMLVQTGKDIIPALHWESRQRVLSAWADFSMAFGIEDFTTLFVNDQA